MQVQNIVNEVKINMQRALFLTGVIASSIATPAFADTFNSLDVSLVGTAALPSSGPYMGSLYMTPSTPGAVGAAWLTNPVATNAAFSTTFSFSLNNVGGLGNADGLALVFQNAGTSAIGSSGGFIGADVPDSTTPNGSVSAYLQTFWQDYGIGPNTSTSPGNFTGSIPINAGADLSTASQITGTETVSVDPSTKTIVQTFTINYTINGTTDSLTRSTTAAFDLQSLFGSTMFVGLTAATGGGTTDQVVTDWTVSTPPAVPEPASAALISLGAVGAFAAARRSKL